jgi:TetR/AcrR family transcriptional repressor of nem operon
MRVTQQDMDSNHERIIEGASRLMRERGVKSTSVADAMSEAGMTHGGFYRHFRNKDELVIAALRLAFDEFAKPLEQRQSTDLPQAVGEEYKALYLSKEHVDNPRYGCPMPALGGDLARESDAVRAEFSAGLQRIMKALAKSKEGSDNDRDAAAAREVAMLVGAVVIARAADPDTAKGILAACRS